ncbi:acyl-ACP desaturase [Pontibacter korlensis]|uniref:Fatty acid desaturase n=1 Tax=Pontibacter korlensis TaxID=400092 RepID=A0A0E3ZC80_9BACT|nr:fatty acid desaturase [Pontibacter korlensis]
MFKEEERKEVMAYVEPIIREKIDTFLTPIDTIWQPSDLLPDTSHDTFHSDLKELQQGAEGLPYDLLVVLIGDTITEEALPTYSSWLSLVRGVGSYREGGWMKWVRHWSAEENRHGDLLNKYLYLCGRINTRMVEVSTQYLIADGFDLQTDHDPYRNFIYTSFQELATNVSHRRVGSLAKKHGEMRLSRMCGMIASDEMRHAKAYKYFFSKIIEIDPNGALVALEDMMRKKIVMPAHFLRELGGKTGKAFVHFSDAAQRLGVYTAADYVAIFKDLLKEWRLESLKHLSDEAERSRDYLFNLADRLTKVADRIKAPSLEYQFSWING